MARIVQFIHPGPEHGYDEIVKEKNIKNGILITINVSFAQVRVIS